MQSPVEASRSDDVDFETGNVSGVNSSMTDSGDDSSCCIVEPVNKRPRTPPSSSSLPSSSSTTFCTTNTRFKEPDFEQDENSRVAKKQKVDNPKGESSNVVVDESKESLISHLTATKATNVFDPATVFDEQGIDTENLDVDRLMMFGYMELRMVIEWARLVPGFRNLAVENQMALLKSSFMELNVLRLSYRSMDYPGKIKFAQGIVLPRGECTKMGWGPDLINSTLEFIDRLREVNIDPTEFSILSAVVLASPDAAGVVDRDVIIRLQNQMLDVLEYYCTTRYPLSPRRYGKILLRLSALRTVSARAADNFLNLSLHGQVKMNALVAEMMS